MFLSFRAMQINIYLISQLELSGLLALFGYVGVAVLVYYNNLRRRKLQNETSELQSLKETIDWFLIECVDQDGSWEKDSAVAIIKTSDEQISWDIALNLDIGV